MPDVLNDAENAEGIGLTGEVHGVRPDGEKRMLRPGGNAAQRQTPVRDENAPLAGAAGKEVLVPGKTRRAQLVRAAD